MLTPTNNFNCLHNNDITFLISVIVPTFEIRTIAQSQCSVARRLILNFPKEEKYSKTDFN